ncbi:MAG: hypothetical protein K1X70_09560 [Leptospirales bacterium]|nr:hypothetical protein [Leptospirales bacterium]
MKTPDKLLDSKLPASDPEYNNLFKDEEAPWLDFKEIRGHIEDLWMQFKPFADTKFRSQILANFHACYFEMYIGNILRRYGEYELCSEDYGPDFFIKNLEIWIECIIASNGEVGRPDSVPEYDDLVPDDPSTHEANSIPVEQVLLRYTQAFSEKERQISKYIANGMIRNNQPCVIAINAAKVRHSHLDPGYPRILAALFPIGDQFVTFDINTGGTVGQGIKFSSHIKKSNQALVSKLAFASHQYSHISGVIFSRQNVWNLSSLGDLGAELLFIPNPYAKNPIEESFLHVGHYCKITKDEKYHTIQLLPQGTAAHN